MTVLVASVRKGAFVEVPSATELTVQTQKVGCLKKLEADLRRNVHVSDVGLVDIPVPVQKVLDHSLQDIGTVRCKRVQWSASWSGPAKRGVCARATGGAGSDQV